MALRKAIGNVELIDARSADPVVLGLELAGYILDDGMAALYGGEIYYGADAVILDLDHDSRSWLDRESFGVALCHSSQGEVFLPDHEVRETHHAPVARHTRHCARTRGGFSGLI